MAAYYPLIAFLCVAGALLTDGAALTKDQVCPEDWTLSGSRCFKFFDSKETWTNAEKKCHSHGANLASIHSTEENAVVVSVIKEATGENRVTWLGAHDAVQEGQWMWTDGSTWDYTNWPSSNIPNGSTKENCILINWKSTTWDDAPGSWSMDYICAKDASKAEPEDKSVSLTLEGFLCKCTPNMK